MINLPNLNKIINFYNDFKLTKTEGEWKAYFLEVKETVKKFINRDRTKDTKVVSNDLANPSVTSQEICMYDYQ